MGRSRGGASRGRMGPNEKKRVKGKTGRDKKKRISLVITGNGRKEGGPQKDPSSTRFG